MLPTDPRVLHDIVKAYDVRGTVPDQLNADVAYALGVGFASFCGGDRVLIGHDMRPSGPELVEAFARGVREQGLDVVLLGLASTDLVYFAAGTLDAPAAMFTASHNPAQYNGVKFCLAGARPVGQDTGLDVVKAVAIDVLEGRGPAAAATAGGTSEHDLLGAFADHVVSFIDVNAIRPMKVVADTANGMGGLVVPAVFERIPQITLEVMYGELDGTFPNHPADPLQPANQRDLQARVVAGGFDVPQCVRERQHEHPLPLGPHDRDQTLDRRLVEAGLGEGEGQELDRLVGVLDQHLERAADGVGPGLRFVQEDIDAMQDLGDRHAGRSRADRHRQGVGV